MLNDSSWGLNKIIMFLQYQKERTEKGDITAATLINFVKALKLFCEMSDISIPWKKITRGLPRARETSNDRAPTVSDKIKSFGESIGVSIWSQELVTIKEKLFDNDLAGSNNASRYFQRRNDNYQIIRNDPKFSRIYRFQNSDFWFTSPASRLKKIISCIRDCQDIHLGSKERRQTKYDLLMESIVLLSVALLDFARTMHVWHGNGLKEQITSAMRSGDREDKKELVKAAFQYFSQSKGHLPINSEELLEIPPPAYTEPLINNIERIFEHPRIAIKVPLFLEIIVYDYIVAEKNLDRLQLEKFFGSDITLLAKLSKNVISFLERATGFPKEIMEPLLKM
jgi:hypothetical protein